MSAGPWCEVEAPAKLNLFLEVLARRTDGYHELDTLMLAVDLCDRLRVRRTSDGQVSLRVSGEQATADIPSDARNLAVRAALEALALARRCGAAQASDGVELELDKRIPSQAGLGGASSDAAAALQAVELALDWKASEAQAGELLAALGSDTVFFRQAARFGAARCTGRGEHVEALELPAPVHLALIVTPDFGAPTPLVYRALENPLSWAGQRRTLQSCFTSETSAGGARDGAWRPFNRLEEAACRALPRLEAWRAVLRAASDGQFCLSGSGSSFFALLDNPDLAQRLRTRVVSALQSAGLSPRGLWVVRPPRLGR